MRTIISAMSILSIFWILSCNKKKSDPEPEPVQPVTSTTTTGANPNTGRSFTWTISNATAVADSITCFSYRATNHTKILAADYVPNNFTYVLLDINDSLYVRQYTLGAGTVNELKYYSGNIEYPATSGTLNITACDSTQLSGNFQAVLSTGAVITGTLTTIRRYIF